MPGDANDEPLLPGIATEICERIGTLNLLAATAAAMRLISQEILAAGRPSGKKYHSSRRPCGTPLNGTPLIPHNLPAMASEVRFPWCK